MQDSGWFFFFGGGVTRNMGVVHKNFISFVALVPWRGALLQGVRGAIAPRTKEFWKFCYFFNEKYKFCWKISNLLKNYQIQRRSQNFGREHTLGARPRRGSGGRSPPDAREFSKLFIKISKENCKKMHYFSPFFKNILKNHAFIFRRFWRKTQSVEKKWFDKNSIETLIFFTIFGNVVAKNRAFGNKITFLQFFHLT